MKSTVRPLLVFCFLLPSMCHDDNTKILLSGETIDTLEAPSILDDIAKLGFSRALGENSNALRQWYVQTKPGMVNASRYLLKQMVQAYLPHNAHIVVADKVNESTTVSVRDLDVEQFDALDMALHPGVEWVGERSWKHKLPKELQDMLSERRFSFFSWFWSEPRDERIAMFYINLVEECGITIRCNKSSAVQPPLNSTRAYKLAQRWRTEIEAQLFPVHVFVASHRMISVACNYQQSKEVLEWFARQPEVLWIDRQPVYQPQGKYSTPLLSDGTSINLANHGQSYVDLLNLSGVNEYIGIADTGIDWLNCFFWEPSGTINQGFQPPFLDLSLSRRKIVTYQFITSCAVCGMCPVNISSDQKSFTSSSNRKIAAATPIKFNIPSDSALSNQPPRNYDSSGASVIYNFYAATLGTTSITNPSAGAYQVEVQIQVFIISQADALSFNPQNPDYSKCLNVCNRQAKQLQQVPYDQSTGQVYEVLGAATGGYTVVIVNRGAGDVQLEATLYGEIQFMSALKPCGDGGDDVTGHGTHVSGTVAGKPYMSPTPDGVAQETAANAYKGIAYNSKIYFMDLMQNSDPNCITPGKPCNRVSSMTVPTDVYTQLFQQPYKDGVRIHLDTWGCSFTSTQKPSTCNTYSTHAADIDKFVWDHPDFLVVVAAGDAGDLQAEGTIVSPGTCKNCITVGASESASISFTESSRLRNPMEDMCGACSFPSFCSRSAVIGGVPISSASTLQTQLATLPSCCNDTLHQFFSVENFRVTRKTWYFMVFPNISSPVLTSQEQQFISQVYDWERVGASVRIEFIAGQTTQQNTPRLQVFFLSRRAFFSSFATCLQSCKTYPCTFAETQTQSCAKTVGGCLNNCTAQENNITEWVKGNSPDGFGIAVFNLDNSAVELSGQVSIHQYSYPCNLVSCCSSSTTYSCCPFSYPSEFGDYNACQQCSINPTPGVCYGHEQRNLAPWSSRGPASSNYNAGSKDLRIKPDVVAPGDMVISANSNANSTPFPFTSNNFPFLPHCGLPSLVDPSITTCNLLSSAPWSNRTALKAQNGTSVSAALIAGAAALVRQYFREGWYPLGVQNSSYANPNPSAALIKAILLNSARSLGGYFDKYTYKYPSPCSPNAVGCVPWVQPDPSVCTTHVNDPTCYVERVSIPAAPNMYEGFGQPALVNGLWTKFSNYSTYVTESSLNESLMTSYTFSILGTNPSIPFKATLVYTDPPASPGADILLVNNLDLIVQIVTIQEQYDPNIGVTTVVQKFETLYGNDVDRKGVTDSQNPSEQVSVSTTIPATNVTVIVVGTKISSILNPQGQKYSLVISGLLMPQYYAWIQNKQVVVAFIGPLLPSNVYSAFNKLDVFRAGGIQFRDLQIRFPSLSKSTLQQMIQEGDDNQNGVIGVSEWELIFQQLEVGAIMAKLPQVATTFIDASLASAQQTVSPSTSESARPRADLSIVYCVLSYVCILTAAIH